MGRDPFDDWLGHELERKLGAVASAPAPRPRYASARSGRRWWLMGGAGGALTAKLAGGLVVAVFATGAAATALTGSASPTSWGSHIRDVVEGCQDARTASDQGIGSCVSSVAQTHGPSVSSSARTEPPTPSRSPDAEHSPPGPPSPLPSAHGHGPSPGPTPHGPPSPFPTPRGHLPSPFPTPDATSGAGRD
jgi:hypothetical protein